MLQLPNVIGFTFGVIQMGLHALYRNATPSGVPAAKEVTDDKVAAAVDDTFKVPEHVVTIAKLGAPAAVEVNKASEVHPVESPPTEEGTKQEDDEPLEEELSEVASKGRNATEQV
jgi:solute carrier family 50 protein (sugar transporter)